MDKELLIKEIEKYNRRLFVYNNKTLLDIFVEINDKKQSKKLLINNELGLLGNLLYKYKDDKEVKIKTIITILKQNKYYISNLYTHLYGYDLDTYKDNINSIISKSKMIIDNAIDELKDNKEFILEILDINSKIIKKISKNLKGDDFGFYYYDYNDISNEEDIVIDAIRYNEYILQKTSDKLKDDEYFMLEVIKISKNIKKYINEIDITYLGKREKISKDEDISNEEKNFEIIQSAMNQNKYILKYTSERLRDDKEFMLKAIKQNGYALKYASVNLKGDKQLALKALKQDGTILKYLSKEIQNDKKLVLTAVKQNYQALVYANKRLQKDKDIVVEAIIQNNKLIEFYKNNRDIMLELIKQDGYLFKNISEELRNDKEILIESLKQDIYNINYTDSDYLFDEDIIDIIKSKNNEDREMIPISNMIEYIKLMMKY